MNEKQAIKELKELQGDDVDVEAVHSRADDILCDLLNVLGYYDVTAEYEKVRKWYA